MHFRSRTSRVFPNLRNTDQRKKGIITVPLIPSRLALPWWLLWKHQKSNNSHCCYATLRGGVLPGGSARKGYFFQASGIWEVGVLLVEVSVIYCLWKDLKGLTVAFYGREKYKKTFWFKGAPFPNKSIKIWKGFLFCRKWYINGNFTQLTWKGGCIDNQIFLPWVLRCTRFARARAPQLNKSPS